MRKISLVLIFCFLFQGCVGFSSISVGRNVESIIQELGKTKECTFSEVLNQKLFDKYSKYWLRYGITGYAIDIIGSIYYIISVNPIGIEFVAVVSYGFASLTIFEELYHRENSNGEKMNPYFEGWKHNSAMECKEDFFVTYYYGEVSIKQGEINFIKQLLHYPPDYNISRDENFTNFQKDFLRNNKIQTFGYYRYIHYLGGKAKFENDFGKYLYTR